MTAGHTCLLRSGGLLGLAFGGFLDGILLHQILQWHPLLSRLRPGDTEAALGLAAATGAQLAGGDATGRLWVFAIAEPGRLARAAPLDQGARPAALPGLPGPSLTPL